MQPSTSGTDGPRTQRADFIDRRDAGRQLAARLADVVLPDPLVLALPRGGVPVGFEIARALNAPLDVLLVRKLGAPGNEEFGIGAIVDGDPPQTVLNTDVIATWQVTPTYVAQERERQLREIERRRRLYGRDASLSLAGRSLIVVDDGVATGGTMRVALRALASAQARRIVVAVPVAAPEALALISDEADEVVCLAAPPDFYAVGVFYRTFDQTSDEEVIELLRQAGPVAGRPGGS